MKTRKLIALIAIAGSSMFAGKAFAQGNDDTPPKMSDISDSSSGNAATDSTSTEKVTIDGGTDAAAAAGVSGGGIVDQPERKEKLRVYSGKQDGNNVISDPR